MHSQVHAEARNRIQGAIALLGKDPRPSQAIALSGRPGYRVPAGDYGVICTIEDDELLAVVVNLGHRRDIY